MIKLIPKATVYNWIYLHGTKNIIFKITMGINKNT